METALIKDTEFCLGVTRCLVDYCELVEGAGLVIACQTDHIAIALSIQEIGSRLGFRCRMTILDGMVFQDLADSLDAQDSLLVLNGTSSMFGTELARSLRTGALRLRHCMRVFDTSQVLFARCFQVPRADLAKLNSGIITAIQSASALRVRSSSGTDLTVPISSEYRWVNNFGGFDGKQFPAVAPCGEVATYSSSVHGVFVADGAINTNFGWYGDPRLHDAPITLRIEDSNVIACSVEDPALRILLEAFGLLPNATRVGEVGIGTNPGSRQFVPFVSHINERHPGFHLGLGSHNQSRDRVPWSCPMHLDLIADNVEIWADDRLILSEGHFMNVQALRPTLSGESLADTI